MSFEKPIKDYNMDSSSSRVGMSVFESPLRKPSEFDIDEESLKYNQWIGNLSGHSLLAIVDRRQYAVSRNKTYWIGITSHNSIRLETPIGKYCQDENEYLHHEVKRLRDYLRKRDSAGRSKSQTKYNDDLGSNLYIKEINNKNIEITKLRESYSVLKSENYTLSLVIRYRYAEVYLLTKRLEYANQQKKRVYSFELAMSESKNVFKDIEYQIRTLDREGRAKDRLLDYEKAKIVNLTQQLRASEERMTSLERTVNSTCGYYNKLKGLCEEARRECEEWKRNYIEASRQLYQLPELYIKLKNSQSTIGDLQYRITELLTANEKFKLQIGGQTLRDRRYQEMEILTYKITKELREKSEKIDILQYKNQQLEYKLLAGTHTLYNLMAVERQLDEKSTVCKNFYRKLYYRQIICGNLYRELRRLTEDMEKSKERNDKIDHVSKENKRLTGLLIDKINLIEQLQMQINSFESKIASIINENSKLTALYEQSSISVREMTMTIEESKKQREHYSTERQQMHEKLYRLEIESVITSTALQRYKELSRTHLQEKYNIRKYLEIALYKLTEYQSRIEILQSEKDVQSQHDRKKIEDLQQETKEVKRKIDQYSKRYKYHVDTLRQTEAEKEEIRCRMVTLQKYYDIVKDEQHRLTKWKQQYLKFMATFGELSDSMYNYSRYLQ